MPKEDILKEITDETRAIYGNEVVDKLLLKKFIPEHNDIVDWLEYAFYRQGKRLHMDDDDYNAIAKIIITRLQDL